MICLMTNDIVMIYYCNMSQVCMSEKKTCISTVNKILQYIANDASLKHIQLYYISYDNCIKCMTFKIFNISIHCIVYKCIYTYQPYYISIRHITHIVFVLNVKQINIKGTL